MIKIPSQTNRTEGPGIAAGQAMVTAHAKVGCADRSQRSNTATRWDVATISLDFHWINHLRNAESLVVVNSGHGWQ